MIHSTGRKWCLLLELPALDGSSIALRKRHERTFRRRRLDYCYFAGYPRINAAAATTNVTTITTVVLISFHQSASCRSNQVIVLLYRDNCRPKAGLLCERVPPKRCVLCQRVTLPPFYHSLHLHHRHCLWQFARLCFLFTCTFLWVSASM